MEVISIGKGTFSQTGIIEVYIPTMMTNIGDEAFNFCEALMNITMPESVRSIGYSAFEGCTSLTNISIPSNMAHIGEGAFGHIENLMAIYKGISYSSRKN